MSGSSYKSFFLMIFFGVGTMPAIFIASIFYQKIIFLQKNNKLKKILGLIIVFYGIYSFFMAFILKDCHSITINHFLLHVTFF